MGGGRFAQRVTGVSTSQARVSHQHLCWEERQPGGHRAVPSRANGALPPQLIKSPEACEWGTPCQAGGKAKIAPAKWKKPTWLFASLSVAVQR